MDISEAEVGLKASPTQVFRSFTPEPKGKGRMLSGTNAEMVAELIGELTQKHLISVEE